MTKTLTQEDFKCAPDWVRSAAVDEDGYAWGFTVLQKESPHFKEGRKSNNGEIEEYSNDSVISALSGNQSNV